MSFNRVKSIIGIITVLIGVAILLPGCVSTGGSTSGHVDAQLRQHGI